jgi:hypothetical protein
LFSFLVSLSFLDLILLNWRCSALNVFHRSRCVIKKERKPCVKQHLHGKEFGMVQITVSIFEHNKPIVLIWSWILSSWVPYSFVLPTPNSPIFCSFNLTYSFFKKTNSYFFKKFVHTFFLLLFVYIRHYKFSFCLLLFIQYILSFRLKLLVNI